MKYFLLFFLLLSLPFTSAYALPKAVGIPLLNGTPIFNGSNGTVILTGTFINASDVMNLPTSSGGGSGSLQGVRSLDNFIIIVNSTIVNASLNTSAVVGNIGNLSAIANSICYGNGSNCPGVTNGTGSGSGMTRFNINLSNNTAAVVQNNTQLYFLNTSGITLSYDTSNFTWGLDIGAVITKLSLNTLLNVSIAQLGIGGNTNLTPAQLGIDGNTNLTPTQLGIDGSTNLTPAQLGIVNITPSQLGLRFNINLSNNTAAVVQNDSQLYFLNNSGILLGYNLGNFTWDLDISAIITKLSINTYLNLTIAQLGISGLTNLTPSQLGITGDNNWTIAQLGISGTNNLTLAQLGLVNSSRGGNISGGGASPYVPVFSNTTDLTNSIIQATSTLVTVGGNATVGTQPATGSVQNFSIGVSNTNILFNQTNTTGFFSFTRNVTLTAPNGTIYNCGVSNTGTLACIFLA